MHPEGIIQLVPSFFETDNILIEKRKERLILILVVVDLSVCVSMCGSPRCHMVLLRPTCLWGCGGSGGFSGKHFFTFSDLNVSVNCSKL